MTTAALLLKSPHLWARKIQPLNHFQKALFNHQSRPNIRRSNIKDRIGSINLTKTSQPLKRYLASASKSKSTRSIIHEPPLPIRVALVSASTALCTPVFPAIGFVNVVLRAAIRDPNIRYQLSGSMGSILSIAFYTILPYSYQYAPLLVPCAIGNGIAAGGAYAALDVIAGGPTSALGSKLLRNPLIAGGGIGAFTGLVAPLYLYGPIYNALYGLEGISDAMFYLTFPHFTGISVATGFAAGVAMYPVLHYPIYGIPSVPWGALTGVVLLGASAALFYIYNPNDENVMPLPEGSFVSRKDVPLLDSIIRYDAEQDKFGTYSLTTNTYVGDADQKEKGQIIAEGVRKYQSNGWGSGSQQYTFDNQVLSVLGNFLDSGIADRFEKNLVKVKDTRKLQDCEEIMYRTDWVVKCMMERNSAARNRKNEGATATEKEAADMERLKTYGAMGERECKRRLRNIESTSTAVELIMILRLAEKFTSKQTSGILKNPTEFFSSMFSEDKEPSMPELEKWMRKRCPGILLYKNEEMNMDGLREQSVEAQLERMGWNPPKLDDTLVSWQEVCGQERGKKLLNGLVITTSLLASYWLQL